MCYLHNIASESISETSGVDDPNAEIIGIEEEVSAFSQIRDESHPLFGREVQLEFEFPEPTTKECNKCHEIKPLTEFYKDAQCLYGVVGTCKSCKKRYNTILPTIKEKKCSLCGEIKDITEFGKRRDTKSGVMCMCKECFKKRCDVRLVIPPSQTRVCIKCGAIKYLSEFTKQKYGSIYGVKGTCKTCELAQSKIKRRSRQYKEIDPDQTKECTKCNEHKYLTEFRKQKMGAQGVSSWCKPCEKKHREEKKEQYAAQREEYKKNNPDKIKSQTTKGRQKRKEQLLQNPEIRKNNNSRSNVLRKERRGKEPLYRLAETLRTTTRDSFKKHGYKKGSKTERILGCTFEELKVHLESQFKDWMTWDNRGNPKDKVIERNKTWDIDHIIPLSSAKTEQELLALCHYTNLQPLCSYINRFVKRDRLDWKP